MDNEEKRIAHYRTARNELDEELELVNRERISLEAKRMELHSAIILWEEKQSSKLVESEQ